MSAVLVIRAIVWCSPQLGHWETSSKRRRQYTQRKRPGSCVGRSHGSPQPGQAARRMMLPPLPDSVIPIIIALRPADEETGGAIAVGTQLNAVLGVDPLLVLALGDRAGRVDQRPPRSQRLQSPPQQLGLDLGQALDRRRRLAP